MADTELTQPNHTINQETGFIESNGFDDAFNSLRKDLFLAKLRLCELNITETCKAIGLSKETLYKHLRIDPIFKSKYQELVDEYADKLEWVSRSNALDPKRGFMDRCMQLRWLRPEKYEPTRTNSPSNIQIFIDGKALENARSHRQIVDAEIIGSTQALDLNVKDEAKDVQISLQTSSNSTDLSKTVDNQPEAPQQHLT